MFFILKILVNYLQLCLKIVNLIFEVLELTFWAELANDLIESLNFWEHLFTFLYDLLALTIVFLFQHANLHFVLSLLQAETFVLQLVNENLFVLLFYCLLQQQHLLVVVHFERVLHCLFLSLIRTLDELETLTVLAAQILRNLSWVELF